MDSMFCIVCLKTGDLSSSSSSSTFSPGGEKKSEDDRKSSIFIFWKFARDYLQFSELSTIFPHLFNDKHYCKGDGVSSLLEGDVNNSFCADCLQVIAPVCQLYLELLGVQLRLSWKLGELSQLFESCHVNVAPDLSSSSFAKQVAQVREQLITKCAQKAREYLPRIIISPEDAADSVLPVAQIKDEPHTESVFYQPDQNLDPELKNCEEDDQDDGVRSLIEDSYHPSSDEEPPQPKTDSDWSSGECNYSKRRSRRKRKKTRVNPTRIQRNPKPVIKEEDAAAKNESSSSTSTPWDCELCGPTTTSPYQHLTWHEKKIEKKEKKLQCYFCYKTFFLRQSLILHVKTGHRKKLTQELQFPCPEKSCSSQTFETILQLNEHLYQTHWNSNEDALPICSSCGLGFLDENLLKLHELLHIPPIKKPNNHSKLKLRVVCPECGKDLKNWTHLQSHYNLYHGAFLKTFQCSQCNAACTSALALRLHRIKHHSGIPKSNKNKSLQKEKGPPETCNECGKELKNKFRLQEHIRRLHKQVECELCDEIFIGFIALQEHRIQKHNFRDSIYGKEGETFVCSVCSKILPSRPRLLSHMSDYHSQPNYNCEICNKVYKGRIQLRSHLRNAHGSDASDKKICPHCGKTCSNSKNLGTHIGNVHSEFLVADGGRANAQGHECPHCPEKFRMKYALDRHLLKSHPDKELPEGLIECKVCGLRMLKKKLSYMDYHMETHMTVEERRREGKLHMCHVCGKEFRTRKAYVGHVKAHEEAKN